MYLDRHGQPNYDWMIDSIYQIYTQRINTYGLKNPIGVDDYVKFANDINS
jgi:hypothetical protein